MIRRDIEKERGNTKMFAKHLSHLILVSTDRDFKCEETTSKLFYF